MLPSIDCLRSSLARRASLLLSGPSSAVSCSLAETELLSRMASPCESSPGPPNDSRFAIGLLDLGTVHSVGSLYTGLTAAPTLLCLVPTCLVLKT